MNFDVYGPFEVPRAHGLIDRNQKVKAAFWNTADSVVPGLSSACGCYIFAVKARRGTLPWYVGLTTKRTFKVEALGPHQINHYDPAIVGKVGVKPQLFFVAKKTPSGRFAKPSSNSHPDVEFLEKFLFGIALNRNVRLSNTRNTRFLKSMSVPGVLNSPRRKPRMAEKALKEMLGL